MISGQDTGVGWLRACGIVDISPLGEIVAELLNDLVSGLYHLRGVESIDWANPYYIAVKITNHELATFDGDLLTRLVFLAHDRCLRASVDPRSHQSLTLYFHPRQREGRMCHRHPTLEEAVEAHRRRYPPTTNERQYETDRNR